MLQNMVLYVPAPDKQLTVQVLILLLVNSVADVLYSMYVPASVKLSRYSSTYVLVSHVADI